MLLFLNNPHSDNLSLKPNAEKLLGLLPEERDELYEWILANIPTATKNNAGSFISLAPTALVSRYCIDDVKKTLALYDRLYNRYKGQAYDRECALIPILVENTLQGVALDVDGLLNDFTGFSKQQNIVDNAIKDLVDVGEFNISSSVELANAIDKSPNVNANWVLTAKGNRSTSKSNLLAAINNPTLLEMLEYRNTLETYLDTFYSSWIRNHVDGVLHFTWNQVRNSEDHNIRGTRTGRLSSNPSVLNIPGTPKVFSERFTPLPAMKKYLLPELGTYWLDFDYCAQELRVLAHFEAGMLMRQYALEPNLDLHQFLSEVLTRHLGRFVTRRDAKTIMFAILYGAGIAKLAETLNCSFEEARSGRNALYEAVPGLKAVQQVLKYLWDSGNPITTFGGRNYYKEQSRLIIDRTTGLQRMADFGYKALNYLIQGSSADVTKQAIINYDSIKRDGRFLLSVHDSIAIEAPLTEARLLKEAMCDIPLKVRLTVEAKYGPSYGKLEPIPEFYL
jgi:DNA polymerase-1